MTGRCTRWERWLPGSGGRLKVLNWNLHLFQLLEIIQVLDSISWVRLPLAMFCYFAQNPSGDFYSSLAEVLTTRTQHGAHTCLWPHTQAHACLWPLPCPMVPMVRAKPSLVRFPDWFETWVGELNHPQLGSGRWSGQVNYKKKRKSGIRMILLTYAPKPITDI